MLIFIVDWSVASVDVIVVCLVVFSGSSVVNSISLSSISVASFSVGLFSYDSLFSFVYSSAVLFDVYTVMSLSSSCCDLIGIAVEVVKMIVCVGCGVLLCC